MGGGGMVCGPRFDGKLHTRWGGGGVGVGVDGCSLLNPALTTKLHTSRLTTLGGGGGCLTGIRGGGIICIMCEWGWRVTGNGVVLDGGGGVISPGGSKKSLNHSGVHFCRDKYLRHFVIQYKLLHVIIYAWICLAGERVIFFGGGGSRSGATCFASV